MAQALVENQGEAPGKLAVSNAQLGMMGLLATVAMLFVGFTSAYLVRRGAPDWQPIYLPRILWANTALLALSSLALEAARAAWRRARTRGFQLCLLATGGLGLAFVAGQVLGWRQLAALGVYLPTSPNSSFFYILTGTHALHLLSAVAALAWAGARAFRAPRSLGTFQAVNLCALYWHFLGGVWLYLFVLLSVL